MLVVDLLERLLELNGIDFFSTLFSEAALRNADVLDNTHAAGWDAEGGVFHVGRLFAEDGAKEALFRSKLGFGLRSDLTDEDIARLHFGTDADDTVVVEVAKCIFADVWNVAGDFFRSEFGVASRHVEFRNVNRGVNVVFDHALGDDDGIFEVVTVPRHERDENVTTDGEFAVFGVRSVGEDLALLDLLAFLDDWLLVDAGTGVGTHELPQRIGHDALLHVGTDGLRIAQELLFRNRQGAVWSGDNDFRSRSGNNAVGFGNHHRAGIAGGLAFETGTDERRLGNEKRHALALHV